MQYAKINPTREKELDKMGRHTIAQSKAIKNSLYKFRKERKSLQSEELKGMSGGEHTNRALAIEKKFGRDYHTGRQLNR